MRFYITYHNDKFYYQTFDSFNNLLPEVEITDADITQKIQDIQEYINQTTVGSQTLLDFFMQHATDEEKVAFKAEFPEYQPWTHYKVGTEVRYKNHLYRVIQAHTAQPDWLPPDLPALYLRIGEPGEIPDYVQPTGAHDAYQEGDKVKFDGKVYQSLRNGNVWSPDVMPKFWQEELA